jgi:hypothetical protein
MVSEPCFLFRDIESLSIGQVFARAATAGKWIELSWDRSLSIACHDRPLLGGAPGEAVTTIEDVLESIGDVCLRLLEPTSAKGSGPRQQALALSERAAWRLGRGLPARETIQRRCEQQ